MSTHISRRRFLRLVGGSGAVGTLALSGCSGTRNVAPGGEPLEQISRDVDIPIVAGGPNELLNEQVIYMVAIDGNEGRGFTFLPAAVWLAPGGRVLWTHLEGRSSKAISHTVTVFKDPYNGPTYSPEGAEGWDSGILPGIEAWKREEVLKGRTKHFGGRLPQTGPNEAPNEAPWVVSFDPPRRPQGVYLYSCQAHDPLAMVGSIVVGDVGPDSPGWSPAMTRSVEGVGFTGVEIRRINKIRERIRSAVGAQ